MDNSFADSDTSSSDESVIGRVGRSSQGGGETPPPAFLFAGKSLIEATVSQVLKDFKAKYEGQVEEKKKLQDKLRRLEGGSSSGEEGILRQRVKNLEGKVKKLKGKNQSLKRKLGLRKDKGGEADLDATTFAIGLEAEETQQICPADIPGGSPVTSEASSTSQSNPASRRSSGEAIRPAGPSVVSTSSGMASVRPRFRPKPAPPKKIARARRSKTPPTVIHPSSSSSRASTNQNEAQPQTMDHFEVPISGTGDFRCSCGQTFGVRYRLKTHLLWFKGQFKFPCDYCGNRFFSPNHLNRHLLKAHKQASTANFGCYGCGKTFPSSVDKRNHQVSKACKNPPASTGGTAVDCESV